MIDWDQVRCLRSEVGVDDFEEVVVLFFEETQDAVDRLANAPSLETLEGDLHFLKGSALSLGFSDLSKLCQEGENLAAQGKQTQVDIQPVLACYQGSKDAFLRECASVFATEE